MTIDYSELEMNSLFPPNGILEFRSKIGQIIRVPCKRSVAGGLNFFPLWVYAKDWKC